MDTANIKSKKKDIMLLDIGSEMSRYYSQTSYLGDSLVKIYAARISQGIISSRQLETEIQQDALKSPKRSRTHDYTILKNCPKSKLNLIDRFAMENYRYEEDIPVFDWELSEDTMTVCGYLCKKAATTFRGRDYEAWYAPQIPVSSGPWKFAGLPGLILRIKDTRNMFLFLCTHMTKPEEAVLIDSDRDYGRAIMVSKSRYNRDKQKFMDNSGAFMTGNPVVQQNGPLPAHNYVKKPFNPIELTEK
jgi:GLPGLI family protein